MKRDEQLNQFIKTLQEMIENNDKECSVKKDCVYLCYNPLSVTALYSINFEPGKIYIPKKIKGEWVLKSNLPPYTTIDFPNSQCFIEITQDIAQQILNAFSNVSKQEPDCYILACNEEGKIGYKPAFKNQLSENEFSFDTIESAKEFYEQNKLFIDTYLKKK